MIEEAQPFCRRHWFTLPKRIRKDIWRGVFGRPELYAATMKTALEFHINAYNERKMKDASNK